MTFYSRIENPKSLRKSILEAAKEILIMEVKQKKFLELKDKRENLILQLDKDLARLSTITKKLDDLLPEKQLKKELYKKTKPEKKTPKKVTIKKQKAEPRQEVYKQPAQITEMDRLEYTLKKIEDKIAQLS